MSEVIKMYDSKEFATINNVTDGEVGHLGGPSMHSSEIDGIHWIDVTEEFLNRTNPFFVKKGTAIIEEPVEQVGDELVEE